MELTGIWAICDTSDSGAGALGIVSIPSTVLEDEDRLASLFEVAFDPHEGAVWKMTEVPITPRAAIRMETASGRLSPEEVAHLFEGSPARAAAWGDYAVNAARLKELTNSHKMLTPAREAFIDGLDVPVASENADVSIEGPVQAKDGEEL